MSVLLGFRKVLDRVFTRRVDRRDIPTRTNPGKDGRMSREQASEARNEISNTCRRACALQHARTSSVFLGCHPQNSAARRTARSANGRNLSQRLRASN